ncbi:MAG: petH [Vampirovibrio sp.]|jgi:ferredoxin--NADP+ reductase|nr:petH [Vampirovibrio sp.]
MTTPSTTHTVTEVPSNIYKPNAPLEAKVIKHERLTAPDSPNDVCHIVYDISGSELKYVEGQSIGVLPPGEDANGKPHKLRLYSIASPGIGDDGQGKTLSVCVKRAITVDAETGKEYHGVCSSYLCNLKVGDTSKLTGPVGKAFLMPDMPNANIIMVATGTGIAPFRAFLSRRYNQLKHEKGQSWLFFGAQTRKDYLYESELEEYAQNETCHIVTAFSREEKNAEGGRMYVQHRLIEHGETLFNLLKKPETYLYICGLRGMESGILEGFQEVAARQGIDWNEFFDTLKAEKRWHVEVY